MTPLAAAICAPSLARAQTIPKDFVYDFKFGVLDVLSVWASPFHGSLHKYEIAVASLGVVALASVEDDNVAAWVRANPNSGALKALTPFREISGLSLVNIGSGDWHPKGALAVYAVGLFARSPAIRDIGMGCLAASEAHAAFRNLVYSAVARERPLFRETINGVVVDRPGRPYRFTSPGSDNWYDNSFFAGHVTSTIGCVSVINHRFHLGYAEPVLWAFGSALALGRIADQRHYTSDVLLGGLVGFGVGKLVGDRSRERAEKRAAAKSGVSPKSGDDDSGRRWTDGVYFSNVGGATVIGWRTPR